MDRSNNSFVVIASRWNAAKILMAGVVFTAMSIYVATRPGPIELVLGVVGICFSFLCSGYALFRFVRPGVAVVIDEAGIVDNASAVGVGRMSWKEIAYIHVYYFGGHAMLGIVPKNIDAFLGRQSWWRRLIVKANIGLGCPAVNIPQSLLPLPVHDVLAAINRQRRTADLAGASGPLDA